MEKLNLSPFSFFCASSNPDISPVKSTVKQAKDVAAGAVLIAAMGAALIGLLVLGPPLLALR